MVRKKYFFLALILVFILRIPVQAANIEELQQKIVQKNSAIKQLEDEIKIFQKQIDEAGGQAKTLESTLAILTASIKKSSAQIRLTEDKIQATNLRIQELSRSIGVKQSKVQMNRESLADSLREIRNKGKETFTETFLSSQTFGKVWQTIDELGRFSANIQTAIASLNDEKAELEDNREAVKAQKAKLLSLEADLKQEKNILESSKADKNNLLIATKNKESEFRKILAEKIAAKAAFERELFEFESELKIAIDPRTIPNRRPGILSWPLAKIYITQLFGKTIDSKRLYTEGTHNGVDLRASLGTPVLAALDGVVSGTGNTDSQYGCYSYGKWIMVDHKNGLSTLYGHLSFISVSSGQSVQVGQVIGYSGSTGYSTGPHLHFGVYATTGVRLLRNSLSKKCSNVVVPSAPREAYLNPLDYVPTI